MKCVDKIEELYNYYRSLGNYDSANVIVEDFYKLFRIFVAEIKNKLDKADTYSDDYHNGACNYLYLILEMQISEIECSCCGDTIFNVEKDYPAIKIRCPVCHEVNIVEF